ncbi:beta-galactosidase [Herbiconiux ginsengi]|uniref:beta-galactosidase n=1 Tax=Herbiconiux ginsengi TaxID=381665 RepID=A0A1H3K5Y0_9MICO|nr:beta-galactosidase [Herbiconiux ginsengi]SDY47610.1 beta-galactosidase [Herbiconiux ginsengi]
MLLGVQYYRPPSPDPSLWEQDIADIARAGFGTVQLWLIWGWVETTPGEFEWGDYDRLLDLAHANGLTVVISTIAEMQPAWLLRRYPDAAMVDHLGRVTPSTTRVEAQSGVTPGGSIDDPRVLGHMRDFLDAAARHFAGHPALVAWDCWNENRWAMEGDGYLDYSPASIRAFHSWLRERYGDLEGVARAWRGRFATWEDVQPGRKPGLPYTDLVAFQRFLTERAAAHLRFRRDTIRAADPAHPISAHCGEPSVNSAGSLFEQPLSRGNDFALAAELDGYGCSSFPNLEGMSMLDLGLRIEATRSAAGERPFWLAELQGGGGRLGHHVLPAVRADEQQRWLWNGMGRGAKGTIVWQWRDEVLGRESGGFGFSGDDGHAPARAEAMARTASLIAANEDFLDAYRPEAAQVGVLFLPDTYYLEWAQDGNDGRQVRESMLGWMRAFEELQLPYEVLDPDHLDRLDDLKLLVLPWPLSVPPAALAAVATWVERGGLLLTEADLAAFDEEAFYHPPGERTTSALGLRSLGRRELPASATLSLELDGVPFVLPAASWLEQYDETDARVLARDTGRPVALERSMGAGAVVSVGSFLGLAHSRASSAEVLRFTEHLVERAGVAVSARVPGTDGTAVQWRRGTSGDWSVLFLIGAPHSEHFVDIPNLGEVVEIEELMDGRAAVVRQRLVVGLSAWGVAVVRWR